MIPAIAWKLISTERTQRFFQPQAVVDLQIFLTQGVVVDSAEPVECGGKFLAPLELESQLNGHEVIRLLEVGEIGLRPIEIELDRRLDHLTSMIRGPLGDQRSCCRWVITKGDDASGTNLAQSTLLAGNLGSPTLNPPFMQSLISGS